jgi:hypothetical protein
VPVLREPLPAQTLRLLRRAVLDLATSEHRRRFPAVLHVGTPGADQVLVVDDPGWDRGLRADLVATALHRSRSEGLPWVWLTRPGSLSLHDADAAWLGPAVAAALERGDDAMFVVVTRHGWLDPRSGLCRTWQRIRRR